MCVETQPTFLPKHLKVQCSGQDYFVSNTYTTTTMKMLHSTCRAVFLSFFFIYLHTVWHETLVGVIVGRFAIFFSPNFGRF